MTSIQIRINGQPFEVELHDGVQVTIDHGRLVIRAGDVPQNSRERLASIDFFAGEMTVVPIQ